MTYVARCAICLDTSPHCACRWQGNGYWAPGSSSRAAEAAAGKPCACLICLDAAKRGVEIDQVAEFPPLPMRYTPCEKHRATAAELERLIQSTTTADELRTFSGDQRQLLQDVVSCPDCKVADRAQRCVKCGEAWRGDTGKAPCAAGGQCEIPAARKGSSRS